MKFDTEVLVVTHVALRKNTDVPLEGPYSSVTNALKKQGYKVKLFKLPLSTSPFSYILDIVRVTIILFTFVRRNNKKKKIVIGIDPLSCFALIFFKKIWNYSIIFYSVDFNTHRFTNSFLQFLYEKADEISSRYADQVWVVCESLKNYKDAHFKTNAIYIPNSNVFTNELYQNGVIYRTGNKMAWTGSCITSKQFTLLFKVISQIVAIRPDLELYFAPTGNHDEFKRLCKQYDFKKSTVLELNSRREFQEFAATCDVGIAIYDPDFGSTEFIEPLKIWDFMLCGLPFIISCEPSLASAVVHSGVAHILAPRNVIQDKTELQNFLEKNNLTSLQKKCVALAKEYDIGRQISIALKKL